MLTFHKGLSTVKKSFQHQAGEKNIESCLQIPARNSHYRSGKTHKSERFKFKQLKTAYETPQ